MIDTAAVDAAAVDTATVDTAVVLMSVYHRESAENLDACLHSIVTQTLLPQKIILVKDGPLPTFLEDVIDRYAGMHPDLFEIVPLPQNRGLTEALNTGLSSCHSDLIFRMDSDDLSLPDRFEKQLRFMQGHPDIGVLSSAMYEFDVDPDTPEHIKTVVADHDAIAKQMPWRNPINHPTCCYRTELIKQAGGYPELRYLEDYYLWAKLLCSGVRFHNLDEPLYLFRFNRATLTRRGGWINFRNECYLRWFLYRRGKATLATVVLAMALQLLLRFAPGRLQNLLWKTTRKRISK
mgnify:CR=1 FL=1